MRHDTFNPVETPALAPFFGMQNSREAASLRGGVEVHTRRVAGARLSLLRADLPEWQPLARPTLAGGVQLTVDLRAGGWRRAGPVPEGAATRATRADAISLESLDPPAPIWIRGRFDMLTMTMQREVFDNFAGEACVCCEPGAFDGIAALDPIVGGMARTLAEAMAEPVTDGASYIAPLLQAMVGRVMAARPRDAAGKPRISGALAPWQERKAKAMLSAHLADDICIVDVARECCLSRSHFCKAFKLTTGQSPYAWLTHRRISTAQSLLRGTQQPLAEIALACGFGDQSHLTRMFSRMVGTPPGSWRRALMR